MSNVLCFCDFVLVVVVISQVLCVEKLHVEMLIDILDFKISLSQLRLL